MMRKRRAGRSEGEGTGDGGPPTFEDVVKGEWAFVVDVAQSCGVAKAQREDVAIEVFVRLEHHFEALAPSGLSAIRAWLHTTTVHIAREQPGFRALRPRGPADPERMAQHAIVATPEEQLITQQTHQSLRAHIAALEPNRREVFLAYVVDDEPIPL